MQPQAYMMLADQALERPDELERLEAAADRDPELDDAQRSSVLARIGTYLADHDRTQHDPDTGQPAVGDELEGQEA